MKNNITTTQKKAVLFGALSEALEQKNEAAALFIENLLLQFTQCHKTASVGENSLVVQIPDCATKIDVDDRMLTAYVEPDAFDWYTPHVVDKTLLPALPAGKCYSLFPGKPIAFVGTSAVAIINIIDNK